MNPWAQLIERPCNVMPPSNFDDEPVRLKAPANPWNLTTSQCRMLDVTCEKGSAKAAAEALGVTVRTVECHWYDIRQRMKVPTMIQAVVEWVKFRQAGGGEPA